MSKLKTELSSDSGAVRKGEEGGADPGDACRASRGREPFVLILGRRKERREKDDNKKKCYGFIDLLYVRYVKVVN